MPNPPSAVDELINKKNEVIKSISLKINQGEKIAFVGQSGAGKSTLVSLLLRFYEVTKGEISINNVNINEYNLTNLRENVAIVPQEVMLFGGSIYDNIAYGKPSASKEEHRYRNGPRAHCRSHQ